MDMRKYEIYFECWPGYLTSEQRVRYPNIHVLFCLSYKNIVLLPIIMNNHTCEIIMNDHTCEIIDFISGGKINKPLYFI